METKKFLNNLNGRFTKLEFKAHTSPNGHVTIYATHRAQYMSRVTTGATWLSMVTDLIEAGKALQAEGVFTDLDRQMHGGSVNVEATKAARAGGWTRGDIYSNVPTLHFPLPGQAVERETQQSLAATIAKQAEELKQLKAMLARGGTTIETTAESRTNNTASDDTEIPF